ncbi:MAG: xanthine dehydrogenase family protein molybdopterin-binding subunit [Steroidobacteraceae bacterium]
MKKRGRGVASMWYPIGPGGENGSAARLVMDESGTLTLFTGAPDVGQGSSTALAQIAADAVGMPFESVKVIAVDSDVTPPDYGSVGSRVTYMQGNSVRLAGEQMRDLLLVTAKNIINSPTAELEIIDGFICDRQLRDLHLEVAVVLRHYIGRNGKDMETSATFETTGSAVDSKTGQGSVYPSFVYATQIAEVEVDTETGEVVILRILAAHDSGTIINPLLLEGQIAGGITQGIGMALTEEIKLREGRTLNAGLMDYSLPTTVDVPEIQYSHVQTKDKAGPYGAKCVGEPALVPTAPAILNAIYDATGVRIYDLPATPEKILRAIEVAASSPYPA